MPSSAARAGSSSSLVISRRTHSSNAERSSEPSGLILSSSAFTVASTRRATEAPSAQPTSRPPCSRTRSSIGDAQRVLLGGEQGAKLAEHEAEHLLVAAALDQAVQRARHHPAGAGAAQDARHDAGDETAGAAILHGGEDARQHRGERGRRRTRRGGVGEEAVQDAGQVEAGEHAGDLGAGEHVGGDEAAEARRRDAPSGPG